MKSTLLLVALFVLTGCSTPAPRPVPPASPASLPDKRVTLDPALLGILEIKKVQDMPSTQGYLKFQVDVQNLSSSAKTVVYQVDWLDKDGVSLGLIMEEPPWTLFPKETLPLAISAPAPTAKDFRLTFHPRSH